MNSQFRHELSLFLVINILVVMNSNSGHEFFSRHESLYDGMKSNFSRHEYDFFRVMNFSSYSHEFSHCVMCCSHQ